MNRRKVVLAIMAAVLLIAGVVTVIIGLDGNQGGALERNLAAADPAVAKAAAELVHVTVAPAHPFRFGRMEIGALQHLDRDYTYDVVPESLVGGFLFQGIHRPPEGTEVRFDLSAPATVYMFFHHRIDGGYGEIFAELAGWVRHDSFPQYDIENGDHGKTMVMYELEAAPGRYRIPPTTAPRACFNLVFQPRPERAGSPARE